MNLTDLANGFGSDKGTTTGNPPHRYTHIYDLIFYPLRERSFNFLEMGLAVGGPEVGGPIDRHVSSPSVQMWLEYFPRAQIYGFDISDFSHLFDPRFHFIRGDSGSETDLGRVADAAPDFEVIVDDASHASFHQQLALKTLWHKIPSGGIYVIEDLQWQSPAFEAVLPPLPTTSIMLQKYFEEDVYLENSLLNLAFMERLKSQTYSFSCFYSLDGAAAPLKQIIIRKT